MVADLEKLLSQSQFISQGVVELWILRGVGLSLSTLFVLGLNIVSASMLHFPNSFSVCEMFHELSAIFSTHDW